MENEMLHRINFDPIISIRDESLYNVRVCIGILNNICNAVKTVLLPIPRLHAGDVIILFRLPTDDDIAVHIPGESEKAVQQRTLLKKKIAKEVKIIISQKYGTRQLYIGVDDKTGEVMIRRFHKSKIDTFYEQILKHR